MSMLDNLLSFVYVKFSIKRNFCKSALEMKLFFLIFLFPLLLVQIQGNTSDLCPNNWAEATIMDMGKM